MKTVKEVFPLENGVYGAIQTVAPTDYTYLFGSIEPSDLDLELLSKCGNRICSPVVTFSEEDPIKVAYLIMNRYCQNWKRIKDAMNISYDVLNPVVSGYTITKAGTTTREATNSREEASKVYGFDSEEGADDTSHNTSTSEDSTVDISSTTTYNKRGVGNLTPNRLIQAEISFRQLSFLNITLNDIKEFITLNVY